MKYLVVEKMDGEGCDYTIGCGMRFHWIDADSVVDAQEKAVWPDGRDEYCTLEGDFELSEILIVPADKVHAVDVESLKKDLHTQRRIEQQEEVAQAELAELKRLQEKYSV